MLDDTFEVRVIHVVYRPYQTIVQFIGLSVDSIDVISDD